MECRFYIQICSTVDIDTRTENKVNNSLKRPQNKGLTVIYRQHT